MEENLLEIIDYYKARGAAREQTALVSLLREAQELGGGVLTGGVLDSIAGELALKPTYLAAVIKRISDLRTEETRHRLTVCGGASCGSRSGAALRRHIEQTYAVQNGAVSARGGFSYQLGGCMKCCKDGPCIRWDGKIYTDMTPRAFDLLVKSK